MYLILPVTLFAGNEFVPLAGIPGITPTSTGGLANYLNQLYKFLIIIGAIAAAIKITIAGAKYAFGDVITNKEEAKDDIMGVLKGLGILLIPFVVLNTIYSGLTNLNILGNAPTITIKSKDAAGTTGTNSGLTGTTATKICSKSNADISLCANECRALGGTFTESTTDNTTGCVYETATKTCTYEAVTTIVGGCTAEETNCGQPIIDYPPGPCRTQCTQLKGTFVSNPDQRSSVCTYPKANGS